nr:reverse transcriptase domain-containing protein [Tanacetum cinerariifolium]
MCGFHLFADVAKYGRTYNRPMERFRDGKLIVGSNFQSVSINENVFQSFNSYAKAVLGNKSMDMSSKYGASDHRKVQLNELNKLHDQAYEKSLMYKEKTKRLHDSKIKDRMFNIGDRVLLFNSRLKIFLGKLKSRWSGPFTISHVFPYGPVDYPKPTGQISK